MLWLTIFQAIVFISYITFLLIRFKGPLESISDSWYQLPKPWNWLFYIFCLLLGGSTIFQGDFTTPLFFFGGAGLMFTGTAGAFKSSTTKTVHFIGAIMVILFSLLGLGVERHCWYPIFAFTALSSLVILIKIKDRTWWIEICAFIAILIGYFLTINL